MEKKTENNKLPYVAAKIDKVLDGDSSVKAFATVCIANSFMVHNIKVIEGNRGLFVSMPSRTYTTAQGETKYADICHPISAEMKQKVDDEVIKAYKLQIGENEDVSQEPENESPFDVDFMPSM